MNDAVARATGPAISGPAAEGRVDGGGVDIWSEGRAGGCGEGDGEVAVCGADALLADGFVVLLEAWSVGVGLRRVLERQKEGEMYCCEAHLVAFGYVGGGGNDLGCCEVEGAKGQGDEEAEGQHGGGGGL